MKNDEFQYLHSQEIDPILRNSTGKIQTFHDLHTLVEQQLSAFYCIVKLKQVSNSWAILIQSVYNTTKHMKQLSNFTKKNSQS